MFGERPYLYIHIIVLLLWLYREGEFFEKFSINL